MTFVSLRFFLFFPLVILLYFLTPKKTRWITLLISSLVFYFLSSWQSSIYLVSSILTTYLASLLLEKTTKDSKQTKIIASKFIREKRIIVFLYILINFGLLLVFKYNQMTVNLINILSPLTNIKLSVPNLLLPLGISFYTFQATGYVIDVYRDKIKAERNFFKLALFISFFPQIIQGPINSFNKLQHQLITPNSFHWNNLRSGIQLMIFGYFKKLVIADRIAPLVNHVFDLNNGEEGFVVLIGVFAYSIQVYTDFSGGIDICRGLTEIIGINMEENFRRPFFARSISEFWQRWHITLGSWMREYVFYPLALSNRFTSLRKLLRKKGYRQASKVIPTALASMIVFILVGMWHGSSFKFIAFGIYHGVIIMSSTLLENRYKKISSRLQIKTNVFSYRLFQIIRTNILCTIGRYFSRSGSFLSAIELYKRTLSRYNPWIFFDGTIYKIGISEKDFRLLFVALLALLIIGILQEKGYKLRETISKQNITFQWTITLGSIFFIIIFGAYGPSFDAVDFIYQGF